MVAFAFLGIVLFIIGTLLDAAYVDHQNVCAVAGAILFLASSFRIVYLIGVYYGEKRKKIDLEGK